MFYIQTLALTSISICHYPLEKFISGTVTNLTGVDPYGELCQRSTIKAQNQTETQHGSVCSITINWMDIWH